MLKKCQDLLLLLRSASLTTAHLHHLAPRSMLKGLLTLRLEDCASSHLKLAASRCSLSYAASCCILPSFPQILQISINNNLCYRCSNWGERNVSTTHRASATIGTTYAAARLRIQGSRVTICNIFNFCIFADKFLFCTMQVMEITLGRQKRLHNDTLTKNRNRIQDTGYRIQDRTGIQEPPLWE